MMHIATVCAIAMDIAIVIDAMIAAIKTIPIDVLTIKTRTETSTMLATIAKRIAGAITIAITRITSTIRTIAIGKLIAIIDQAMARTRTIMPCTPMLAAARVPLARAASPPLRARQSAPPPLHLAPAADPGLVKTTTSLTKDATVLFRTARGLILTLRKTSTV